MEYETTDHNRSDFEMWASQDGKWGRATERNGDGYKLASTQSAWVAWKAATAVENERCGGLARMALVHAKNADWSRADVVVDLINAAIRTGR